jgi:hypothetical protein
MGDVGMKRLILALALAMVVMVSPAWGGELDGKVIECKSLAQPDGGSSFYEFKNNSVHRHLFGAHYDADVRAWFKVDPKTGYGVAVFEDYTTSQSVVQFYSGTLMGTLNRQTMILRDITNSDHACTVITHAQMRSHMRRSLEAWKKRDQEERNKNKI